MSMQKLTRLDLLRLVYQPGDLCSDGFSTEPDLADSEPKADQRCDGMAAGDSWDDVWSDSWVHALHRVERFSDGRDQHQS